MTKDKPQIPWIKGKVEPQIIKFKIVQTNSQGIDRIFTLKCLFEGTSKHNFHGMDPSGINAILGGRIILNLETDDVKILNIKTRRSNDKKN